MGAKVNGDELRAWTLVAGACNDDAAELDQGSEKGTFPCYRVRKWVHKRGG
jgi:hypothetical protein